MFDARNVGLVSWLVTPAVDESLAIVGDWAFNCGGAG